MSTTPLFERGPVIDRSFPRRTAPSGDPWVRWKKPGWYAAGSRDAVVRPGRFWDVTLALAVASTEGRLDRAHTGERGILCCGALGVSFASGYAQRLLHLALLAEPERFLAVMARLIQDSGVYVGSSHDTSSGSALFDLSGRPLRSREEICQAIPGGTGAEWSTREKQRAHLWVTVLSKLFRDERMDAVQANFAKEVLPPLLTERTCAAVRWPQNGAGDAWEYTKEQQALWALALVMSHEDEAMTEDVLHVAAVTCGAEWSPSGVIAGTRRIMENNHFPSPRFRERFLRTLDLIAEAKWTAE